MDLLPKGIQNNVFVISILFLEILKRKKRCTESQVAKVQRFLYY